MDYRIQISGLKQGKHNFEFPVKGEFFTEFGNSRVKDADLEAHIVLDKGSGWMNVSCRIEGNVTVECDRCLEDLKFPMDFTSDLAVKSAKKGEDADAEDAADGSDEYLLIDPSDGYLDMKQFIYDYVCVNLPLKAVHPDGECNAEMLAKLEKVKAKEMKEGEGKEPETYAAFSGLAELLKNGKKNK